MSDPLGWGIVGPGEIARVFADSITASGVGRVVGVTGGRPGSAERFAEEYGTRAHATARDLARAPRVEALYVASPHVHHAEAVIAGIEERVGVLCEKPMTTSSHETMSLLEFAREQRVPVLEGWMYLYHPQIERLHQRLKDGEIGTVRRVESCFGFEAPYDPGHRLFSPHLGGGAILDVGGYPLGAAVVGLAGTPPGLEGMWRFEQASCVWAPEAATGRPSPGTGEDPRILPRVDLEASAVLRLDAVVARIEVSMTRELGRVARYEGDLGTLEVEDPFLPEGRRRGRIGRLIHTDQHGQRHVETVESEHDCFSLEALELSHMVRAGELEPRNQLHRLLDGNLIAMLLEGWRDRAGALE